MKSVREDARDVAPAAAPVYNCTALNSASDDFAPVIAPNGDVLFTSNRRRTGETQKLSPEYLFGEAVFRSSPELQLPVFALNRPDAWSPPASAIPGVLDRVNTGAIVIDTLRRQIIVSGTYLPGSAGGADLYMLPLTDVRAAEPLPINAVNSPWWDAQPALSRTGDTLVFASDRIERMPSVQDTGRRAPSLWMSTRTATEDWSAPVKLPAPVHSGTAEMSPFFGPDGWLYFATKRWPENGFEIVRSRRTDDGTWTEPERLPAPVNSDGDDCFPYLTADRMQLLLASNRGGGAGGYDIWCAEMPYCIALSAQVHLHDVLRSGDTTTAMASGVRMEVLDFATGRVVASGYSDAAGLFLPAACLHAGARYMLRPGSKSCYSGNEGLVFDIPVPSELRDTLRMEIDLRRQPLPEFYVVSDSIPFFVTGYWFPNTTPELAHLRKRLTGGRDLPNANFIDTTDYDYDWAARRVDVWFGDLYTSIENLLVPMLDTCYASADTLVFTVKGYVDPRGLAWGKYDEPVEVRTLTRVIRPGDVMSGQEGNVMLSHLRAWYAMHMIDDAMAARSERYRTLRSSKRIRLRAEGGYVGHGETGAVNDPLKRKFTVSVEVREER
jgi:hypothetical protein